ncbi:tyrosine-type recombinase/integrase [Priestia megaterium]|uniref:tyrosine-type recombinase/integrase n=1 Tax=Priestia megaterium TaxID=1404 RepID=UPI0023DAA47A|nr:tyrosine-type recombinase/integrase [Priestia megaterium]
MKQFIDTYLEKMAEEKSASTVKGHKSSLNKFASMVNATEPAEVLAKDVRNFRDELYKTMKTGTVNTMLKRLKTFFDWCVAEGLTDVSPASEIKLLVEGEQLPKWLSEEQEDLLLKAVRKKYLGASVKKKSYREYAIIMLMLKAGLRISEVTNLKHSELSLEAGKVLIRGKGQQQRTVHLIPDLVKVLVSYIEFHGSKGEYVFFSQMSDKITERMVQNLIKNFKGVSLNEVVLDELHPHMLRHTFAHNLAKAGMPIESIARVLGHMKADGTPNIQQTIRYTKSSDVEIGENMDKILGIS